MSDWAGMKKAINSTIGTDNFKSLDTLILDNEFLSHNYNIEELTSGTDIFSVSNSKGGRVHFVNFPSFSEDALYEIDVVVKVDNNDLIRRRCKQTSYRFSFSYPLSVVQRKYLSVFGTDRMTVCDALTLTDIGQYPSIVNLGLSSEELNSSNYYRGNVAIINKPIEFSEKFELKIEMLSGALPTENNGKGVICYELYD